MAKTKAKQNTKKSEKEKTPLTEGTSMSEHEIKSLYDLPIGELARLLNERQKKFVEELEKGGTPGEAAIRAGYAPKNADSQASRLLKDVKIAAYRRARAIEQYNRLGISAEWVGLQLIEVLNRCMGAVPHMVWDSDLHDWVPDGTWNFDAKGALQALGKIGDSLGMFKQEKKQEQTGGQTIEEYLASLGDGKREF